MNNVLFNQSRCKIDDLCTIKWDEEEGCWMWYIIKYTFHIISRRKRNFCLTAFVIALGISLVVQTQILGTTVERNYKEILIESFGNTDILIFSVNEIYFSQNVSDILIQEFSSVFEGILPQIVYSTTAYGSTRKKKHTFRL